MIQKYTLHIRDVSSQRSHIARGIDPELTVGELVTGLVPRLRLAERSPSGEPVTYTALLEREQRHLNQSEVVGEALEMDDEVIFQPEITAG